MAYNPNNKDGLVQSGQRVWGIVVDRDDPQKRGRFKVRIMGDQDDIALQPDEQLQWIQCKTPNQPQLRGNGTFPAQYMVGSKVELQNYGQQGYIISGAYPNNETNQETQDVHVSATPTSHENVADAIKTPGYWVRKHETFANPELKGSSIGRMFLNGAPVTVEKRDPKEAIQNETPNAYKDPKSKRIKRKPISNDAYDGSDKPDEFMDKVNSPYLLKNAGDMIKKLRETIKSGSNPTMPDSVGGMGNIMSALSAAASLFAENSNQQQKKQDRKNVLESQLRKTYNQQTGKTATDIYGAETAAYKAWRQNYLDTYNLNDIYDVETPYTGNTA